MGEKSSPAGVSDREGQVLRALAINYGDEQNCLYIREISTRTGLDKRQARRAVRALARKGLAEYVRGLFDDEGKVAGSGYCCTRAGNELDKTFRFAVRGAR